MANTMADYVTQTQRTAKATAYHEWLLAQTGTKFKTNAEVTAFERGVFLGVTCHQRWQAAKGAAQAPGGPGSAASRDSSGVMGTREAQVEAALCLIGDEFGDMLAEVTGDDEIAAQDVRTFIANSVLTHNRGVTLRLSDGSEFQITIIKSSAS